MAAAYNPNYEFLHTKWKEADIICLQGSSRSGKTYSIYDFIIWIFVNYPNAGIEIDGVRDSLPVLKATILKEFVDRLEEFGLYDERKHNMTDKRIEINGNYFNYYSIDSDIKARGRKRHILWLNEPNEISFSIIRQLLMRTTHKVIIDFNPSDPEGVEHWLYDDVMKRPNTRTLITTYKDNPFLSRLQIDEIESYAEKDPQFYDVFGRGIRSAGRKGQIYTHFKTCEELPAGRRFYGLDFGKTNDQTALVRLVSPSPTTLYAEELIYQTNLTSSEIIALMKQEGIRRDEVIVADSAEPLMIREIKDAGFNIRGCVKGAGSITGGIDKVKSLDVYVTKSSKNILREKSWYVWKLDNNGNPTNEPKDLHNHAMDSIRYGAEEVHTIIKRHRSMVL